MDKEELKEMEEMMDVTIGATVKIVIKMISNKDFPQGLAKFTKRYYDALKKEGFTEQQAMEIITKTQVPAPGLGNLPK
jgi:hypothetical protein